SRRPAPGSRPPPALSCPLHAWLPPRGIPARGTAPPAVRPLPSRVVLGERGRRMPDSRRPVQSNLCGEHRERVVAEFAKMLELASYSPPTRANATPAEPKAFCGSGQPCTTLIQSLL